MNADDFLKSTTDSLTTENTIDTKVDLNELVRVNLKSLAITGVLCIHLNKGGVRQIVLSERTKMKDGESDEVRKLLGMP